MRFATRREAGRELGERLAELALADPVVLALPRGGVPVAVEVALRLAAPLDLVIARKIGAPGHAELAAAAVVDGERPELVRNPGVIRDLRIGEDYLAREEQRQLAEIARRRALYLAGRPRVPVAGRTAIVVDDGIATGATIRAALHAVRRAGPAVLVLAVPVADAGVLARLAGEADRIVCLHTPSGLAAVGQHYRDFRQVEDAEVVAMLQGREAP
ncbi:MAG: phosphoribosyltransferase family protein [Geminicoccaceae bacterium]